MIYKVHSSSDLKISKIAFGCANFGGLGSDPRLVGKGVDECDSHNLLNFAYEFGINYFDTAASYGSGRSEKYLGNWIKSKRLSRSSILISTKVSNSPQKKIFFNKPVFSKNYLKKQVEQSLRRLQTDYIDILYIHVPDPNVRISETLLALNDLVADGKIRVFGVSNATIDYLMQASEISKINGIDEYRVVQNCYNAINRKDEKEVIPFCKNKQILYVGYGPLSGGLLTGKYLFDEKPPLGSRLNYRPYLYKSFLTDNVFSVLEKLKTLASQIGVKTSVLVYAWLITNSRIDSFLIGPKNKEQFNDLMSAGNIIMSDELFMQIEEVIGPATF